MKSILTFPMFLLSLITLLNLSCAGIKVIHPNDQNKNEGTLALDLSSGTPKLVPTYTCKLYQGRGMVVTIGRAQAVAQIGPFHASGLIAWLLWCVANFFSLIGIKSPFRVMCECVWYYLTVKPGARLLFEQHGVERKTALNDQAGERNTEERTPVRRAA